MSAPRWTAVLTVASGGVVSALALIGIRPLFGDRLRSPGAASVYAIAVMLLGVAAARGVLARGGRVSWALGLGAASGAACALLAAVPLDEPLGPAEVAVLASFTFAGVIAGALFGLPALIALRPALDIERAPSLDAVERALLPAAIWLAALGALAVLGHGGRFVPGLLALAGGALASALVAARDLRRVFFLRAALRDEAPGWAVVESSAATLPMFARYERVSLDGVLARRRAGLGDEPVARLPRDAHLALAPIVRRAVLALIIALASGGAHALLVIKTK